jgi:hypothetical protein
VITSVETSVDIDHLLAVVTVDIVSRNDEESRFGFVSETKWMAVFAADRLSWVLLALVHLFAQTVKFILHFVVFAKHLRH